MQLAFNARRSTSRICVSEPWRRQIEVLVQRKLSLTLGPGSILKILTLCIEFGRKALKGAKLGPALRGQRQRLRREHRQLLQDGRLQQAQPFQLLRDRHDWPAAAVDLMKSDLGRFDGCLEESDSASPPAEVAAFHHLCCLYSCTAPVRGMHYAQYHQLNGDPILLLEARRQRNYYDKLIQLPRMRHIDPDSSWAQLLLRAAHNYVKGRHIEKAHLGIVNLSIYLTNTAEALLKVQRECPACRRLRGRLARATDAIKLTNLGPCDYLSRAADWRKGQSTVVLDILGPLQTWASVENNLQTKLYGAVFMQLPLKTVKILPVQSYSTADLLQTIKIYVNQSFRPVQLWLSDAGSNLSRFSTGHSGYEEEQQPVAQGRIKAWQDLATGERGRQLKDAGVHIRICSKNHKIISTVEQAVYSTKKVIYAFDKNLKSPLTVFDWMYIFSVVESCIKSRPLCSTKRGQLYSAGSILNALEQAGLHLGDDNIYVHPEGDEEVTAQLEAMNLHLLELREQVGDLLLSLLVEQSFLDVQVRRENIKFRDTDNEIQLNDVCFDPVIYKKTTNVTASLLRLHRWSSSRQSALFQKIGPLKASSFVTRPIDQLFLVAKSGKNVSFGSEAWRPSWNLSDLYKADTVVKPYLVWGMKEDESEKDTDRQNDLAGAKKDTGPPEDPPRVQKAQKSTQGQKTPPGESQGDNKSLPEKQVITRRGRVVKKPARFQN